MFLACVMCIAICIGMIAVIGAGIAYGYNFFLVEFLDYKTAGSSADVTVFVRRGQFADKPEVRPTFRRQGQGDDTDNELFASNFSIDYQDQSPQLGETKPLANSWQKVQETKNYAERLTKYDKIRDGGGSMRHRAEDDDKEAENNKQSEDSDFRAIRPTLESDSQPQPPLRRQYESDEQREVLDEPADFNADPYDPANLPAMRAEDVKRYFSRNYSKTGGKSKKAYKKSAVPVNVTESFEDSDLEQDFSGYKPI